MSSGTDMSPILEQISMQVPHVAVCYRRWEEYLVLDKPHPCSDYQFHEPWDCCRWGKVFSRNLTAVMMVMKEAMHRQARSQ